MHATATEAPDTSADDAGRSLLRTTFAHAFHPTIVLLALVACHHLHGSPELLLPIGIGFTLLMTALEQVMPARPEWKPLSSFKQVVVNFAFWMAGYFFVWGAAVATLYDRALTPRLIGARESLGLPALWPSSWPVVAKLCLAWLIADLISYWFHRAQHRWGALWRATAHGVHHSPTEMYSIKAAVNHPFEFLLLLLPIPLVVGLGAGPEEIGCLPFVIWIQVHFTHCNLPLRYGATGWILQTGQYHLHHHSVVREEQDTNYGCCMILWDRLFGTFRRPGHVASTGVAPGASLGLAQQLLFPIRPVYSAPSSRP
ncbi:sterol desaturase family protein [Sorangium sp. So ce1335]|uniref:sterol desaturase family protein n=1 Tax=Sorangium sp. So ce1335 TaxID=3133335 RepID=UPI003F639A90